MYTQGKEAEGGRGGRGGGGRKEGEGEKEGERHKTKEGGWGEECTYTCTLYVIDNVHLKFNTWASCCMGLLTTPLIPISHVLTSKCTLCV